MYMYYSIILLLFPIYSCRNCKCNKFSMAPYPLILCTAILVSLCTYDVKGSFPTHTHGPGLHITLVITVHVETVCTVESSVMITAEK